MSLTCTKCQSNNIDKRVEKRLLVDRCLDCGHTAQQPFIIDDMIRIVHTSSGIKHINTAAIIRRSNQILLVKHDLNHNKFELPVSHLCKDESLEYALDRTVCDVLGISITTKTLLTQLEQPVSSCRYGADTEEWAVFDVSINESDFAASCPTREIEWVVLDKLSSDALTAETHFALKSMGLIQKNNRQK